jgi:hypothetical protein
MTSPFRFLLGMLAAVVIVALSFAPVAFLAANIVSAA